MNASDVIDDTSRMPADLVPVIAALAQVGRSLCRTIKRGPLGGALGEGVGENLGGDQQKALDVMADAAFAEALVTTPVRYYASEEQDEVVELVLSAMLAGGSSPRWRAADCLMASNSCRSRTTVA